jgi:hypothetical protein
VNTEQQITRAAERVGIEFERVAQVRGRWAATFYISPDPSYGKGFSTSWYNSESELLGIVLDTLEHLQFDKENVDVNIFSAEMFEYLSAEMLPGNKVVSLTVKGVEETEIAGPRGTDMKVVISFVERPKKLILNKTNARAIAKTLGPETDDWRGASITMGVESVKVGRNVVPSIRIRGATPPVAQTVVGKSRSTVPANGNGNPPTAHPATAAQADWLDGMPPEPQAGAFVDPQ